VTRIRTLVHYTNPPALAGGCLVNRVTKSDISEHIELPEKIFYRKIGFVLRRHGDVREVMWLRPFDLRVHGKFGFLCNFALRVPVDSSLSAKKRLELSLTHKNGHSNEDFFLDQHQKISEFLQTYFEIIKKLKLHDGSEIELENKLSVIPSFTLSTRSYVFGGGREGKNQFFGLRDYAPLQQPESKSRLIFVYQSSDRPKSHDLFRALRGDTYSTFTGMERMFRIPIDKSNVSGIEVSSFDNEELKKTCIILKEKYSGEQLLPIVVVPYSKHVSDEESLSYFKAKHAFLSQGLASQFVDRDRLNDRNALKWSISNIGLAVFAKMGGVPWQVHPSTEKCLIVGIGQAHRIVDGNIEKYVAYSVLTDSSGIYESIKVLGNSTNRQTYMDDLKANLRQVLFSHKNRYKSFVIHVTFSMKHEEINLMEY
jgi:Piwi domain